MGVGHGYGHGHAALLHLQGQLGYARNWVGGCRYWPLSGMYAKKETHMMDGEVWKQLLQWMASTSSPGGSEGDGAQEEGAQAGLEEGQGFGSPWGCHQHSLEGCDVQWG